MSNLFDNRFGFSTHFDQASSSPQWNPSNIIPLIARSGAGWVRDDLNWSLFELSQGVYAESVFKQPWIDMIAASGLKFVACIAQPPTFYPSWDPTATASFCAWLSKTEGSKVGAIEVVNEPNNIAQFQGAAGQAALVKLTNEVRTAVHAVSPNTPVIGLDQQGSEITSMLGLNPVIDGLVFHPYDSNDSIPEHCYEPPYTEFRDFVAALRSVTKLPLWTTEQDIATQQPDSEYDQSVWVGRRILESFGLGVEHTFIYDFIDSTEQGVLTYYDRPRQAYFVIERILKALNGLSSIGSVATVTNPDANFVSSNFRNYVFTGTSSWSPTVAAVWFGNQAPTYFFGSVSSKATIQFPQKHPHVGGSAGGSILDLVTGETTAIQASQYTSAGITGVTITDRPQLIILT